MTSVINVFLSNIQQQCVFEMIQMMILLCCLNILCVDMNLSRSDLNLKASVVILRVTNSSRIFVSVGLSSPDLQNTTIVFRFKGAVCRIC